MASPKGKTWFAMLGFLNWKPMSGYDIKKLVDISLSYFWTVSYGQIYPLLKRLVDGGFATVVDTETQGKRSRDLYQITTEGQKALEQWMKQPVDLSTQRDEMQLKLFLGAQGDTRQMMALIQDFRCQHVARLRTLEDEYDAIRPCMMSGTLSEDIKWLEPEGLPPKAHKRAVQEQSLIFLLSIRQGILKSEARIAWCDEALALLANPPYDIEA